MKKITHTLVVMIIALVFLPLQAQIYTFTNAGASGSNGPTQGQIDVAYTTTTLDGQVTINTQGIQEWTVPVTGSYKIEGLGAEGGASSFSIGGPGAQMVGDFNLTAGTTLKILVGQQGQPTQDSEGSGGGGGSFVVSATNTPLLIASGGGGGGRTNDTAASGATINTTANSSPGGGTGGAPGNGGYNNGSVFVAAGNGGGFNTNGENAIERPSSTGGFSFLNGGTGGNNEGNFGFGGFGGGGGGGNNCGYGGGGGGYSGGGGAGYQVSCGRDGGGGGSINTGVNQVNTSAINSGNGQVIITLLNAFPVITCPGDITVSNDPGICGAVVNYTVTANDDEDGVLTPTQTAGLPSGSEFPVGVTTNTFEVTDSNGNTATCSFEVTVNDTEAPMAVCAGGPSVYMGSFRVSDGPNWTTNPPVYSAQEAAALIFGGNASDYVISTDPNNTDPNTITHTAWFDSWGDGFATYPEDYSLDVGNPGYNDPGGPGTAISAYVADHTDISKVNYVWTASNTPILQLDVNGQVTLDPTAVDAGSTDNCGIASISVSPNNFTCANIGPNTVTLTVTDINGNVGTCTSVVIVEDNIAPIIICPGNITQDNDAGICGAVVTYSISATDNCSGGATTEFIQNGGFETGDFSGWSVVDTGSGSYYINDGTFVPSSGAGSLAPISGSFDVVTDQGGPGLHLLSQPFTVPSDVQSAIVSWNDRIRNSAGVFSDPNQEFRVDLVDASMSVIQEVYSTNPGDPSSQIGPNFRQFDLTSLLQTLSGQVVSLRFSEQDDLGNFNLTLDDISFVIENVNITQTAGLPSGSVFPVGTTTNTFEATDASGNTATCSFDVTVEDNESPVITCVTNTTRDTDAGVCQYTVVGAEFDAIFTDNCTSASITNNLNNTATLAGQIIPKGDTTVIWTVDDGNGQTASCTTVITVEDNEVPVIVCVPNATRDTDAGVCQYTIVGIEFDATFTDNCSDGSITNDFNGTATLSGEILPTGITTVVWNVNDGNGQTASCTTVITVEDNEAPLIVCPANITANTDAGNCFATVNFATPIAFDNCNVDTIVQTIGDPSGSQFPVGVNTIEFTATDVNGNSSACSFTITVIDNEAPVAVCQNITIQLDASGNASIAAADVDGGSTDQCGVASITIDMDTFDCSNVGDNNVILTVTDVNGNLSTCTAIVTVEDVTVPTVACQDITVELDPVTGMVTISGADIDNGSTDACGIASYDLDIDTFDCSNIGANTVVLTVTDVNGNTATCTATVTVEDNTSPLLVCQDFTLEIGADGTATLNPSDVIASNDDACGIFTTAVDITEFSCADIGTPVTVQVFSQDNNGNLSTCTATVTVVDNLAPVVTCPADQTVDPGAGNLFYLVPDYFATGEATAVDNCTDPVTITTQNPAVGTPLSDGTYTITLTATDEYGNIGTCEFELTVDSVLGIGNNNQSLGSIAMYPNPAKGNVTIGNPQSLELESANIYDLTGRLVQTFSLKGMATVKILNVDNLAAATYVVIIKGKEGQITKRLIKE